jgi:hypothetical protein
MLTGGHLAESLCPDGQLEQIGILASSFCRLHELCFGEES